MRYHLSLEKLVLMNGRYKSSYLLIVNGDDFVTFHSYSNSCCSLSMLMSRGCEAGITSRTRGAQGGLTVGLRQVFQRYRVVLGRIQLDGDLRRKFSRHFLYALLARTVR